MNKIIYIRVMCGFGDGRLGVRLTPTNRHRQSDRPRRKRADCVAKAKSCRAGNFARKQEATAESSNLSRVTEVAGEFSVGR